MDNINNTRVERVIFPPNKPMDRKLTFSTSPKLYHNFNYIDFNKEGMYLNHTETLKHIYVYICFLGNSLLGCNNSTGTFWEGTLLYFNDADSMISYNNVGHYIYASTSDGKFLSPKMVYITYCISILIKESLYFR